jgi:hypothetical protein
MLGGVAVCNAGSLRGVAARLVSPSSRLSPSVSLPLCSCDDIWLPHFEFINVRGFSQDRVVRYGIRPGPNDSVAWWAHVQVSSAEAYLPPLMRGPSKFCHMPLLTA